MKPIGFMLLIAVLLWTGVVAIADESRVLAVPKKESKTARLEELHHAKEWDFAKREGFGAARIPRVDVRTGQSVTIDDKKYSLTTFELVGLLKHDEPVAYKSPFTGPVKEVPVASGELRVSSFRSPLVFDKERLDQYPSRPLSEAESDLLKSLKPGVNVVHRVSNDKVVALGALRAVDSSCIKCHDVTKNELLGAFLYTFIADKPAFTQSETLDKP